MEWGVVVYDIPTGGVMENGHELNWVGIADHDGGSQGNRPELLILKVKYWFLGLVVSKLDFKSSQSLL